MHRHQRYEAEGIYKTAISITSLSTILNSHRKPPGVTGDVDTALRRTCEYHSDPAKFKQAFSQG